MSPAPDPLVIYHGNCPDGFAAAWAVWKHAGVAELVGARHGDPPPFERARERHVFVVDFSYPRAQMEALAAAAARIDVYDHHKTAEAELRDLPYCVFDPERSGAGLTWDLLHGAPRPWMIDYVEDRDLWRFALENSREISLWIGCCPHELARFDAMAALPIATVVEQARGCARYLDFLVAHTVGQARTIELMGEPCACVNTIYAGISEVLHALLEQRGTRLALGWYVTASGRLACSLRSSADLDCSAIAVSFGGGGHARATGFELAPSHPIARLLLGV